MSDPTLTPTTTTVRSPAALLRERILAAPDLHEELVHVAAWGVDLIVRGLSAGARAKVAKAALNQKTGELDIGKLQPDLLIATLLDPESRQTIFSATDRDILLTKAGTALDQLTEVAMRLSGMADGQKEAVKSPPDAEAESEGE